MGSWDRVTYEHEGAPAEAPPLEVPRERGPEPRVGDGAAERVFERGPVDSSGHRTTDRELDFSAVSRESFEDLQRGDAPLGMSPEDYREMRADLEVALERDGLGDADVRLQGSAAHFYSRNPNKEFFSSPDSIREHCAVVREDGGEVPPDVEEAAVRRYEALGYVDSPRPRDKVFDQDYVVTGAPEQRSDYDIQISSDTLQAKMEQYQHDHPGVEVISTHGGHWKDFYLGDNFHGLKDWAEAWTQRTGRDVNLAGFAAAGPDGPSAFKDEDWIIRHG